MVVFTRSDRPSREELTRQRAKEEVDILVDMCYTITICHPEMDQASREYLEHLGRDVITACDCVKEKQYRIREFDIQQALGPFQYQLSRVNEYGLEESTRNSYEFAKEALSSLNRTSRKNCPDQHRLTSERAHTALKGWAEEKAEGNQKDRLIEGLEAENKHLSEKLTAATKARDEYQGRYNAEAVQTREYQAREKYTAKRIGELEAKLSSFAGTSDTHVSSEKGTANHATTTDPFADNSHLAVTALSSTAGMVPDVSVAHGQDESNPDQARSHTDRSHMRGAYDVHAGMASHTVEAGRTISRASEASSVAEA